MERRRPIGLPRTRSTFAEGFFQPADHHPPLRRDPFDKFQSSIPSYNRFRDGISDPSSRMFNDDDDLMFFDNFARRPFYADPEFFHPPPMPRNGEDAFYQAQPRDHHVPPPPPPPLHQRSKSHYDNTAPVDNWERPIFHGENGPTNRPTFHGDNDEQMLFDEQQHFPHNQNRHQQQQQQQHRHQAPNDPNVHVIKIQHEGRQPPKSAAAAAGREQIMPNNGKKFVEINNSVPNYEILNSDKRRRRSNSRQEDDNNNDDGHNNALLNNLGNGGVGVGHRRAPSIPNITVNDFSTYTGADHDADGNGKKQTAATAAIPLPAPAIPLPAPVTMMTLTNVENDVQQQQQRTKKMDHQQKNNAKKLDKNVVVIGADHDDAAERVELDEHSDGMLQNGKNCIAQQQQQQQQQQHQLKDDELLQLLDETEHLTEQLRENAIKLEQEKEIILDRINNIKASSGIKLKTAQFSQAERDGLMLNLQRILARCNTVNISIETPRDQHQSRALEQVNKMIQSVLDHHHPNGNVVESKQKIYSFLNACHPDEIGQIDEKFQSAIIECTADDQKVLLGALTKQLPDKIPTKPKNDIMPANENPYKIFKDRLEHKPKLSLG